MALHILDTPEIGEAKVFYRGTNTGQLTKKRRLSHTKSVWFIHSWSYTCTRQFIIVIKKCLESSLSDAIKKYARYLASEISKLLLLIVMRLALTLGIKQCSNQKKRGWSSNKCPPIVKDRMSFNFTIK